MNNSIIKLSLFCFLLLSTLRGAYADNWEPIQTLSTYNGLSSNEVKNTYQDREGYIWIATANGLCRYDGYEIKVYKSNLYTPNLLVSNDIQTITEDEAKNLWVGTSGGLNVYNKITGDIKTIEAHGLNKANVQSLLTDSRNNVWIGTAKGLAKYNATKGTITFYSTRTTEAKLRGNDIKTLIEDGKGNIWIGCWNAGITRYNIDENKFYAYPKINPENSAHVLFADSEGHIWVGSWGYGLFRIKNPYDKDKVEYVNYRNQKNNPNSLSDNLVYAISQDKNTGRLWVGTRSGLSVLEQTGTQAIFKNFLPNKPGSFLNYNEVNAIIRDNTGLMWVGTLGGGVSVINTQRFVFNHNELETVKGELQSNSVRSIFVDNDLDSWLGIGSYGLVKYNEATQKYTYFGAHSHFNQSPINATVYSVTKLQGSSVYWIATHGEGIFVYDPQSANPKVKNLTTRTHPWLTNDCIYALKEDKHHRVWIGTADGVSVYDPVRKKGWSYTRFGPANLRRERYAIYAIEEGGDGSIWLATSHKGIVRMQWEGKPHSGDRVQYTAYTTANNKINDDNIACIYTDSQGRLWAGSEGGGLSLYNKATDAFASMQQQYNIPGDIVNSMVEDHKGNLWLGTNAGLVEIRFSDHSERNSGALLTQYTMSDGLQDNYFNRNAVFKAPSGELYFGGHKGYNHFFPDSLFKKKTHTNVVITDIKIHNKPLRSLEKKLKEKISKATPGYATHITLPHNYNNITLEFSALSFANPRQSSYAYQLKGFDKAWHITGANRRYASYNNLKRGTYHFALKASVGNGQWSNMEREVAIEVLPAPWLSGWAFLVYLAILALVGQQVIKIARSRMALKNAIKVMDIEQQKSNELNHAKLKFFTNITHEFLTPLTILSASVDELKILSPQHRGMYQVMGENINRLIRLLRQVLEFRKAETGNLKLKVAKGDIARAVKVAVDSFIPLMRKNKIHFSLICDPESVNGYFDPDKLDKILYNLLSNASKYNKEGGGVQVNLNYDGNDANTVVITVKDNGPGMEQKTLEHLFQRFYEGDYRRFNTMGTGIGLSLTKDLVTLHKGKIWVESQPGLGTSFYVKLPINQQVYTGEEIDNYAHIAETVTQDVPIEEKNENTGKPKKYTLLVIEDNEELLQLLVKLLSPEYNIHQATNGKEGIRLLEEEYIDLAISDIMMPEMDGMAFCKYVKSKFEISHVPIILLTAKNKEEDQVEAYNAGADGFISKPFNLYVLKSKIASLLKTKERTAQEFKQHYKIAGKEVSYTGMDEEFLNKALQCVHDHIDDADFDQKQFAIALGTSKSTLYKKLKSLTGLNTSSFIRNIRLKTACNILHSQKKIRISELAYAVGFNDPKYFSACFKKEFGLIPSEYVDKIISDGEAEEP